MMLARTLSPLLLALGIMTSVSAHAQAIKPLDVERDPNGVNLLTGKTAPRLPALSIPAAPKLAFSRLDELNLLLEGFVVPNTWGNLTIRLNRGVETSTSFQCTDLEVCQQPPGSATGATISGDYQTGGYTFTEGGSGKRIVYALRNNFQDTINSGDYFYYFATQIIYPDSEVITIGYDEHVTSLGGRPFKYHRPSSAASSTGYTLLLTYRSNTYGAGWAELASATIVKSSNPGVPLARHTYTASTVTDLTGRVYNCTGCDVSTGGPPETSLVSLRLPGEGVDTFSTTSVTQGNVILTGTATSDGVQYNYAWTMTGGLPNKPDSVTITGPEGFYRSVDIWNNSGKTRSRVESITNSMGGITRYEYDNSQRVKKIIYPELNAVSVVYDSSGNIIERRQIAKPGSYLADIVETTHSPSLEGTNQQYCTLSCFQPLWTRDAKGQQTDYTWATGHMLPVTILAPPDANGQRRKTKITYTSNGRPTREEICATDAAGNELTCGTTQSFAKLTTYFGETSLPLTETVTDGIGTAPLTTTYSYDDAGRPLSVDPPLAGTEDATYYRYDAYGRRTWEIAPYNNTSGRRVVTRTSYRNSDDQPYKVESGHISGDPYDTNFVALRETNTAYNSRRLPVTTSLLSGSTTYALTQTSYDARNRKSCTATRMNPAAFGSLPASACALGTQGSDGPDRISQTVYDEESRVLQVRKAVGTPIEIADVTNSYSANGKTRYVIDANGNQAEMRYDGHDRQLRWVFPSTTRPTAYNPATPASALLSAGAVNEGDYEAYSYDANGNRETLRKRDGSVLSFGYDALNRMTLKVVPERSGLSATHTKDVHYGYDIRGLQTFARFDNTGGEGVTIGYDRYGRKSTETLIMDGVSRTITSGYTENSHRLIMYYPDGNYIYHHRNALGGLYYAQSNIGPLFYTPYNPDGSTYANYRWGAAAGNWSGDAITTYGYDPAGRLTTIATGLAGSSYDSSTTFTRNYASQIASASRTNDAYATAVTADQSLSYAANGLNQYAAVNGQNYAYDLNGNLTSDGQYGYTYDIENRLVASGSATLRYDPLGRLYELTASGNTTRFLHDGDAMVAEYNAAGAMLRRYVHGAAEGIDDPLVWFEGASMADSAKRYLFADERGSIVAVTDANGSPYTINRYDEYGLPDDPSIALKGRFRYTSQAWLPEIGLYYYKARMYSARLGRFMQTDPIGYEDQFNLYGYVSNDPINSIDPTGLFERGDTLAWNSGLGRLSADRNRNRTTVTRRSFAAREDGSMSDEALAERDRAVNQMKKDTEKSNFTREHGVAVSYDKKTDTHTVSLFRGPVVGAGAGAGGSVQMSIPMSHRLVFAAHSHLAVHTNLFGHWLGGSALNGRRSTTATMPSPDDYDLAARFPDAELWVHYHTYQLGQGRVSDWRSFRFDK